MAGRSELEERITCTPHPKLPIFEEASTPPWPPALAPLAELARKCCAAAPAERPKASECAALLELGDVTA